MSVLHSLNHVFSIYVDYFEGGTWFFYPWPCEWNADFVAIAGFAWFSRICVAEILMCVSREKINLPPLPVPGHYPPGSAKSCSFSSHFLLTIMVTSQTSAGAHETLKIWWVIDDGDITGYDGDIITHVNTIIWYVLICGFVWTIFSHEHVDMLRHRSFSNNPLGELEIWDK